MFIFKLLISHTSMFLEVDKYHATINYILSSKLSCLISSTKIIDTSWSIRYDKTYIWIEKRKKVNGTKL